MEKQEPSQFTYFHAESMFSKQETQTLTSSDDEQYRTEKMALLIQELLFDERGTWISASYSTLFPSNQACNNSGDGCRNPPSNFPLKYAYEIPDRIAHLDKDQPLSLIDIESESDTGEEFVYKPKNCQKHLINDTKDYCIQTQKVSNKDESFTTSNIQKYIDLKDKNPNSKIHGRKCKIDYDTSETDEIPTVFSPVDFSPSLDSDSSEVSAEARELKLPIPIKRNYFISDSSTTTSQTSSAKTDVAEINLKSSLSANSDSSKMSDGSSFCQNLLPMRAAKTDLNSYTLHPNVRKSSVEMYYTTADIALSKTRTESQSSHDRNAEQNSDSESFKSKSVSSSSGNIIKKPESNLTSEDSALPTKIFTNSSNQTLNKNLFKLFSQNRSKRQKVYASFSENWNIPCKAAQECSKTVNKSLRTKLDNPKVKPRGKVQSIPCIGYKGEKNYVCRSPSPKYSSTSETPDSSSDSFLDIFLAKNPSVLLNRERTINAEGKKDQSSLPWLYKEKQKNYLQISSLQKRKRKARLSKEKPIFVHYLSDHHNVPTEGSVIQASISKNEVKILMPAKPGRLENSETSSNAHSSTPTVLKRKRLYTFLYQFCSVVLKCCCIRRNRTSDLC